MRVAVVGSGTGGASAALLLARDGHAVEIFERVPDPRPVGAEILLQPLGQRILATLGLADELAAKSDLVPVGWVRDLFFGPAANVALVRRQFAAILLGEQTSPLTRWGPRRAGGDLAA